MGKIFEDPELEALLESLSNYEEEIKKKLEALAESDLDLIKIILDTE